MSARAFVDRGQVVEQLVVARAPVIQECQYPVDLLAMGPERGDAVVVRARSRSFGFKFSLERRFDCLSHKHHISSMGRRSVARCRADLFKSRNEGEGRRSTPCGPTTQLKGLRSVPTAFCRSIRPSMKASGRGGQPDAFIEG